jgi:hypothetical protein
MGGSQEGDKINKFRYTHISHRRASTAVTSARERERQTEKGTRQRRQRGGATVQHKTRINNRKV